MRIVIVGAGRAGLEVATHLTRVGHHVTIIDHDEAVTRRASEQHGLVALCGDATVAAVLEEADITQSDVVVAMLRRDADNLAVALLARSAGVSRVMVRMRDNAYRSVYAAAGIDRLPATLAEALDRMERSELVAGALGEHVFDWFLRNKREEWDRYQHHVSRFELGTYLPVL